MTAMPAPQPAKLGAPSPASLNAMTLGEAAGAWAGMGWLVFPIVPRGKTPYAAGDFCGRTDDHSCGFHCATTDVARLGAWWTGHPDSNIGITHPEATVVDEDRLGVLTEANIILPKCPWSMTGRAGGGRHFLLRAPVSWPGLEGDGVKVTYRVPSVEVKGFDKGYIVAPPSVHATGTRYELRMGGYVPEIPMAVLNKLVEVTRSGSRPATGGDFITIGGYALPDVVTESGRYKSIASYTAHLYNRGFTSDEMWGLVQTQLAPRFLPALSDRDLRDRFERATKDMERGLGARRSVTPEVSGPLEDAPLTEFDSRPVEWLWEAWLPRGVVTLMDGNPGVSKSTLVADLVARITTGREWPDGSPPSGGPQRVMWITTEDDPGRVLRPRIEAAGGDAGLVRFVTSEVIFPGSADAFQELLVRRAAEPLGLSFVILDPLFSHLDAKVKSISDADMRQNVMNPLGAAAEASGVSILVVRHFNKDTAASAINRGAGSLGGIVGAARALWSVTVDPEDESGETKAIGVSKLNYARTNPPLLYRVIDRVPPGWVTGTVSGIDWLGEAPVSIATMMSEEVGVGDAVAALAAVLAASPVDAAAVAGQMRSRGFGRDATRGAAKRLHVVKAKVGFGGAGGWKWSLPKESSKESGYDASDSMASRERAGSTLYANPSDALDDLPDSMGPRALAGNRPPTSLNSLIDGLSKESEESEELAYGAPPTRGTGHLRVVPTDPAGWANPCHWYRDHQAKHRQTPSGWTCDACYPEEEPSA